MHISGSLVPDHTGNIRWLDKSPEDITDRSKLELLTLCNMLFQKIAEAKCFVIDIIWFPSFRKKRKDEGETEPEEDGTFGGEASSLSHDHRTKKSKKHRLADDN